MENLLKQFGITEEAIPIYLGCLGRSYLTFYEIYSNFQEYPIEVFTNHIRELNFSGLLIKIVPKEPEILEYYLALPPYTPLLNYIIAFKENLSNMGETIQDTIQSIVDQKITDDTKLDINSLLQPIKGIKEDIEEESVIQRQEFEAFLNDKEIFEELKDIFPDFKDNILKNTQSQLGNLIQSHILNEIDSNDITNKITSKMDIITYNIANELCESYELNYSKLENNIKQKITILFQQREEFKKVFQDSYKKVEDILKKIEESLGGQELNLKNDKDNLKNSIIESSAEIVKDFAQRIVEFNIPIENSLQSYLKDCLLPEKNEIDNIWLINSSIKINEEIINLLTNSKEEITMILPSIENNLNLLQSHGKLRLNIASSDAGNPTVVQNLQILSNIELRVLENDKIIALKGDNNHIVIAILRENPEDHLHDIYGFGTNYEPLINIMAPIIDLSWNAASPLN